MRFLPAQVAAGVWRIVLAWTQCHVLSDGAQFMLVDSGTRRDRTLLLRGLAALHLHPQQCGGVLLTHGHCDHAGNAAFFAERGLHGRGAPLLAHIDERPFVETGRTYVPRDWRACGPQGWMFAAAEIVYPVRRRAVNRVLDDGDTVQTPAGTWRVVHTPGHTPGHVSYFREDDGVLLSGDALLNIVPFVRREALAVPPPIFNSDTAQARRSVHHLAKLAPRVLLPGHGRPLYEDENVAARIADFAAALQG